MIALFDWLGILAPAVAMMVTMIVDGVYLAFHIIKFCGFSLGNLLPWIDIGKIALVSLACIPALIAGSAFEMNPLLRAFVFGAIYVCLYVILLQRAGIDEISRVITRLRDRILPRARAGSRALRELYKKAITIGKVQMFRVLCQSDCVERSRVLEGDSTLVSVW